MEPVMGELLAATSTASNAGKGKGKGKGPPLPDSAALAKGQGKGPYFPTPKPSPSKKGEAAEPITVNVMFLDGRCEPVQVPASDTVRMLKEKLSEMLEYSAYRQTLVFEGRILRNHEFLSDVGVVEESLLNICIKTPNPLNVDDEVT